MNYEHDEAQPHLGGNITYGDSWTYSPSVWNYLIDRFQIKSVLDLGSGRGYAASWFNRRGMQTIAVDGLESNVRGAIYPTVGLDLTLAPVRCCVDLVHCHEMVEHIEEQYLPNLLQSLTCGRFLVMTNALPDQPGYHHVNCQPTEYWRNHLAGMGYQYLEDDTNRVRKLAEQDGAWHMARSGAVYVKSSG